MKFGGKVNEVGVVFLRIVCMVLFVVWMVSIWMCCVV